MPEIKDFELSITFKLSCITAWSCFIYIVAVRKFSKHFRSENTLTFYNNRLHNLTYIPYKKYIPNSNLLRKSNPLATLTPIYDSTYSHTFKFDGRPKEVLYNPREEVDLCTCGGFDCQEQDSMKEIFDDNDRPSLDEYKNSLKDPELSTGWFRKNLAKVAENPRKLLKMI